MQKDSLNAAGVKYDEQGTIQNDYSYVWMTVDVDALKKDETWNPLQFISRSLPYMNINNEIIPGYPLSLFEKWIGADTFSIYPTLYFLLVPH